MFPRRDDAIVGGRLPASCNHLNFSQHSHAGRFLYKFSHTEQKNRHRHAFALISVYLMEIINVIMVGKERGAFLHP